VPVVWWLPGLTCTDQNFVTKAGAQRYAAEHGVAIVAPDTSPRGEGVPDDPDGAYDFGLGAGFLRQRHCKRRSTSTTTCTITSRSELPGSGGGELWLST
jgi:hypothetical protein